MTQKRLVSPGIVHMLIRAWLRLTVMSCPIPSKILRGVSAAMRESSRVCANRCRKNAAQHRVQHRGCISRACNCSCKNVFDIGQMHVAVEKCCTYAAQQNKGQGARIHLLVVQHMIDQFCVPWMTAHIERSRSPLGSPAASIARGRRARASFSAHQIRGAPNSVRPAPSPAQHASPWSSLSEYPVSASSACPNVWPKLSSARAPDRLALILGDYARFGSQRFALPHVRAPARSRAITPSARSSHSHSKKPRSPRIPYLMHLCITGAHFAIEGRVSSVCRYRQAPAMAGGMPRSGFFRATRVDRGLSRRQN